MLNPFERHRRRELPAFWGVRAGSNLQQQKQRSRAHFVQKLGRCVGVEAAQPCIIEPGGGGGRGRPVHDDGINDDGTVGWLTQTAPLSVARPKQFRELMICTERNCVGHRYRRGKNHRLLCCRIPDKNHL